MGKVSGSRRGSEALSEADGQRVGRDIASRSAGPDEAAFSGKLYHQPGGKALKLVGSGSLIVIPRPRVSEQQQSELLWMKLEEGGDAARDQLDRKTARLVRKGAKRSVHRL